MKIKDCIAELEKTISELKKYDLELPCEMMTSAPHTCCDRGDDCYCYESSEETNFDYLSVYEETVYNKKTKKRDLVKVVVKTD